MSDTAIPIIDVDSHLTEPTNLWSSRMTGKWADVAPRAIWDETAGRERWHVGRFKLLGTQDQNHAGWKEFWPSLPRTEEEGDPGAYDAKARLARLDEFGITAQVLYPNLLGFFPFAFMSMGHEAATRCVQVFNDFQVEWCSADSKRLIPLAYLPFWDVEAAMAELRRCADLGFHGFNWGHRFEKIGLPPMRDSHWDPVLNLAQDLEMPASFHIGFGSVDEAMIDEFKVLYEANYNPEDTTDEDLQQAQLGVQMFLGNAAVITELCMCGVCERFPRLKFVSIESGFGYVPFLLEAMDWQYKNNRGSRGRGSRPLPSEYFRRQVYATFWFERETLQLLGNLVDNVMFESDYPHGTSLSPGPGSTALSAKDTVARNLANLPEEVRRKLLYGNAARVYQLDVPAN
jgi:predicted TIM-barrel fold metal-dependent hydrolase